MMAPILCFLIGSSSRSNFSTTGIKKDRVFPLPVTASTTTSLWPMKRGMVEACTGVMRENPMVETASRIHGESGGLRASHALEDVAAGFGAMTGKDCAGGGRRCRSLPGGKVPSCLRARKLF